MTNAKKVLLDIKCLDLGGKMEFVYNDTEYVINCWDKIYGDKKVYSVHKKGVLSINGMNVDKITSKYMTLYNYDMMGTRTTYKMALETIESGIIICD